MRGEPVACKAGYHAYTLNYGDYGPGKAVMVDARRKPLLARVMIGQVRPGQGQQLGFKVGDFLISYDGIEIETVDQIAKIVLNGNPSLPPRPIVLWRAGRELTFSITPGPTGCDWLPRPAPPELAARLGRGG